ncbi:MAG TPA: MFS transporter [Xanthobacteraceae bacterium]|nr:MFS transporter [Xanthobacteraceae bacterium]
MTAAAASARRSERRALAAATGAHALFDGYSDLLYVLLPVWQAEFGLSYAEIGALRGLFSGAMASFQIPSSLLADRLGARLMLAASVAIGGAGYCLAGASTGFVSLVIALVIGGLGASVQHPVASALVARAYESARSRTALGTYNFAGDLGKMAFPALTALLLVALPWRPTLALLGLFGIAAAGLIFTLTPAIEDERTEDTAENRAAPRPQRFGFPLLLSIGVLDSATRMAFLTFLPFLLKMKGADTPAIGFALLLVFAGGATGKLGCAFLGARIGTIATVCLTEGLTAVGILALLPLPLWSELALLPLIGFALNGTSSVLYGSVPDLVLPERRQRAFGIFYTGTIGAGALSPMLYGFVGDRLGVGVTLALVAAFVLLTVPLALLLRPFFAGDRSA